MDKGFEIRVLDHGYVRLVDYMGTDEAIVEAARMSTGRGFVSWDPYRRCTICDVLIVPGGRTGCHLCGCATDYHHSKCSSVNCAHDWQDFPRGDLGILEFMYKGKHMTPFEFGVLHIEVQAPIMVFREWHRHRTHSFSEFSARYSQMPNLHYLPGASRIQKQSSTNRQGSGEVVPEGEASIILGGLMAEQDAVYKNYDSLVDQGIAKEVARLNTPVSRYSKMRDTTDLRNWLAFLILRMAPSAQWEIRQYAFAIAEIIKELWPRTFALFMEYDFNAVHLSSTEAKFVLDMIAKGSEVDPPLKSPFYDNLLKKFENK